MLLQQSVALMLFKPYNVNVFTSLLTFEIIATISSLWLVYNYIDHDSLVYQPLIFVVVEY